MSGERARSLFKEGNFSEAAALFEASAIQENTSKEWAAAALCWFKAAASADIAANCNQLSLQAAKRAVERFDIDGATPNNNADRATRCRSYFHAGRALFQLGRSVAARSCFALALAEEPGNTAVCAEFSACSKAYFGRFFDELTKGLDVSVKLVDDSGSPSAVLRGKGVFAKRSFRSHELVFTELPAYSALFVNDASGIGNSRSCSHCMRSLLRRKDLEKVKLLPKGEADLVFNALYRSFPLRDADGNPGLLECQCGLERYCSQACKAEAWKRHHEFLCPESKDSASPFSNLVALATGLNRTNVLIIAKMFAAAWMALRGSSAPSVAGLATFEHVVKMADGLGVGGLHVELTDSSLLGATETLVANREPFDSDDEALAAIRLCLEKKCRTDDERVQLSKLATIDTFRVYNGLILRNVQRISPVSDLAKYWEENPSELPYCKGNFGAFVQQHSEDALDIVCSSGGSGLFALGNSMNHSCDPNAIIVTGAVNFSMAAISLRPIGPGEEVTFSYIDESAPVRVRQRLLKEKYLFDCRCTRCVRELS